MERNRGAGYNPTARQVAATKRLNDDMRYVQGFPQTAGAGASVPLKISLNSAGRKFLGIGILPVGSSDLSNVQVSLSINNNNVLTQMAAQNANPNYVQGMLFLPVPQPLGGNDVINVELKNNGLAPVSVIHNIWYVPQKGV